MAWRRPSQKPLSEAIMIRKLILVIEGQHTPLTILPIDECHWTSLIVSHHWFWLWLGAVRQQQAIT